MNRPPIDVETDISDLTEIIQEKLLDAETPGFQARFDPLEAEMLGAFTEDALSEEDALDSTIDYVEEVDDERGSVDWLDLNPCSKLKYDRGSVDFTLARGK